MSTTMSILKELEETIEKLRRNVIANDLESAGWPSVADDVRGNAPLETVLSRLNEIGESESNAAKIITDGMQR